jgi:hypothetical protein
VQYATTESLAQDESNTSLSRNITERSLMLCFLHFLVVSPRSSHSTVPATTSSPFHRHNHHSHVWGSPDCHSNVLHHLHRTSQAQSPSHLPIPRSQPQVQTASSRSAHRRGARYLNMRRPRASPALRDRFAGVSFTSSCVRPIQQDPPRVLRKLVPPPGKLWCRGVQGKLSGQSVKPTCPPRSCHSPFPIVDARYSGHSAT